MESSTNLYNCLADITTKTRQDEDRSEEPETGLMAESRNSKRKSPFGSLLRLAWRLCEAEQKKCKLTAGSSSNTASYFDELSVARQSLRVSGDRPLYMPSHVPPNPASLNFRSVPIGPTPLLPSTCSDFVNPFVRSLKHYADDYSRRTNFSPNVPRTTSVVQQDIIPVPVASQTLPHLADVRTIQTALELNDTVVEDELHLSERRRHQCPMCSYQTDNRSHMLRHQATAHDACKLYHCYICKMDFSRSERAKSHFLSIHPEIPYHSKIIRKRPYDTVGQGPVIVDSRTVGREPGVSKMHEQGGAPSGPLPGRKSWEKYCRLVAPTGSSSCYFRCVRCPHVGADIWHLKRHYLSAHSGSRAYSCRVCRYSTGDVQRLIGHMTGHGELFCHQCSFSTVELERFKEHLAICNGEVQTDSTNSQCPVCGEQFEDNKLVKQHVSEVHQRDYCEYCACVIYGPEAIEEHLLQHQTEQNITHSAALSSGGHMWQPGNPQTFVNSAEKQIDKTAGPDDEDHAKQKPGEVSSEALEISEEGTHQSKYRFGRFSNQTYYCPVDGCSFKATWKKSIELHTLNYHCEVTVDEHSDRVGAVRSSSPDQPSATAPVAISGLFNCPFCPNCRTFKYRKSYEKHLLQHGVDYVKHPYLVVRSSQRDDGATLNSSASML